MATIVSAELLAGLEHSPADDEDAALKQQIRPSGGQNPVHLRIVHSTPYPQRSTAEVQRIDMRPPDRPCLRPDRPPAMLDRTVQVQIGRLLRDVFADVAGEPVPERFVALLAALESKEKPR